MSTGRSCVNSEIPLREDTLRLAREARCDQGTHEVEVSFNAESDLHHALIMCDKNPGHHNYTPVREISLDKFPECVQDIEVLEFIKIKAQETVRLTCNVTSLARPEGYTFHNYRGSSMMRCGSGRVWGVFKDRIRTDIPCPFGDCQETKGPHTVSGYIKVHTAMHVIFDDAEAQSTLVDFFYDIPNDRSSVVTARGVQVVKSDVQGDYCIIDCVTHDPDLCTTMDFIRQQWTSRWPQVEKVLYGNNVSVAISHPHGCSKQFSIGTLIQREFKKVGSDQCWYKYTYKAATCPGCSGAPVWVSGGDGLPSSYAPHSGHEGNAVNRSTVWFLWKSGQEQI
ncbi:unnamed protein product [Candidula unifasciata]|uniref:Uncharacterized protein n=1 Tax=Candidula unifasciata TaxID=100452 RepID=A0A8S3ZPW9_9EUPU|nr:unnamed protein product [Candidula unifasciata]